MKLTPRKEDFISYSKTANLITVSTELTMDLDTPVSVYYKLVGEKKGYIMESDALPISSIRRSSSSDATPSSAASRSCACRSLPIS